MINFTDPPKNINPDLIYRFWKSKGRPSTLKHRVMGVTYMIEPTQHGDVWFIRHPLFTNIKEQYETKTG